MALANWISGEKGIVKAAVDSATVIQVGDLLYQQTDDVRPASMQSDMGTAHANRMVFAESFLGIAQQASANGQTAPIDVATSGRWRFTCGPTDTFEIGDLLGVSENVSGDALLHHKVVKVTDPLEAIARVSIRRAVGNVFIQGEIASTVMTGGVLGSSYSGS